MCAERDGDRERDGGKIAEEGKKRMTHTYIYMYISREMKEAEVTNRQMHYSQSLMNFCFYP